VKRLLAAAALFVGIATAASAQEDWQKTAMNEFNQLPKLVRDQAIKTRKSCKEFGSDEDRTKMADLNPMAGIQKITLEGHPSFIVDDAHLCGDIREAAVNCSNRSCTLAIYRQDGKGWGKVLEDDMMENYPVLDWDRSDTPVFQMLVATIWAGDPRCHPTRPSTDYTSGRSCNVIGRYHNNTWQWEKVR
jgi:hypothetical protein